MKEKALIDKGHNVNVLQEKQEMLSFNLLERVMLMFMVERLEKEMHQLFHYKWKWKV